MEKQIVSDPHTTDELIKAGISKHTAMALTDIAVRNSFNTATKQDTAEIQKEIAIIHKDIEQLRMDTKRDIAEVHKEIAQLRMDTKRDIAEVHKEIAQLRTDTKKDIEQLRTDTKRDIAEVRKDIEQLRTDTKRDIAQLRNDTKQDIAAVRKDIRIYMYISIGTIVSSIVVLYPLMQYITKAILKI